MLPTSAASGRQASRGPAAAGGDGRPPTWRTAAVGRRLRQRQRPRAWAWAGASVRRQRRAPVPPRACARAAADTDRRPGAAGGPTLSVRTMKKTARVRCGVCGAMCAVRCVCACGCVVCGVVCGAYLFLRVFGGCGAAAVDQHILSLELRRAARRVGVGRTVELVLGQALLRHGVLSYADTHRHTDTHRSALNRGVCVCVCVCACVVVWGKRTLGSKRHLT